MQQAFQIFCLKLFFNVCYMLIITIEGRGYFTLPVWLKATSLGRTPNRSACGRDTTLERVRFSIKRGKLRDGAEMPLSALVSAKWLPRQGCIAQHAVPWVGGEEGIHMPRSCPYQVSGNDVWYWAAKADKWLCFLQDLQDIAMMRTLEPPGNRNKTNARPENRPVTLNPRHLAFPVGI